MYRYMEFSYIYIYIYSVIVRPGIILFACTPFRRKPQFSVQIIAEPKPGSTFACPETFLFNFGFASAYS